MAIRIAVVGVVAVALFAVLFFRLWALQVISGDDYLTAAQNFGREVRLLPRPAGDRRRMHREAVDAGGL